MIKVADNSVDNTINTSGIGKSKLMGLVRRRTSLKDLSITLVVLTFTLWDKGTSKKLRSSSKVLFQTIDCPGIKGIPFPLPVLIVPHSLLPMLCQIN